MVAPLEWTSILAGEAGATHLRRSGDRLRQAATGIAPTATGRDRLAG
ncbi:hypothetical protein IFT77_07880 [Frigoribacterium sp. CFBP 13729]|jgi:hypothetical protein|nr:MULTISPECIES: hypothetical protein [unclassified Frigoribacterium]MBD8583623.1 hypothetical protein [Frigoribacterium sp. CFBP 8766]MBD8610403.1 hypothetical protein [Frigoribacterium sp. CFBP 13729]